MYKEESFAKTDSSPGVQQAGNLVKYISKMYLRILFNLTVLQRITTTSIFTWGKRGKLGQVEGK